MKQEKRKTLPVRRKAALRRILIAAAALFLVNHIFMVGLLFPIQAIRHNEERMGTGRTVVVLRDWASELGWNYLAYLTENENVTMLSGTNLTPLGWMDAFGVPVDCSEPGPICGGYWTISKGQTELLYIFGRVDDPDIVRLELQTGYIGYEDGQATQGTLDYLSSERERWVEKDGRSYFLLKTVSYGGTARSQAMPVITGYDEAGNEIAWAELEQYAATYIG